MQTIIVVLLVIGASLYLSLLLYKKFRCAGKTTQAGKAGCSSCSCGKK